jgi:hypothetical protein
MKVYGSRQELCASFPKPFFRLGSMTFWAAAVAAGVIGIVLVTTPVALGKVAAEGLGTTFDDVLGTPGRTV